MSNRFETTYHNALRRILIGLRQTAPCLVVLNKELEVCIEQEDEVKQQPKRYSKPCLEYKKPEWLEEKLLDADDKSLLIGKIVSHKRISREDICVCFGEKCHEIHPIYTPDNCLTSVWMNVSA